MKNRLQGFLAGAVMVVLLVALATPSFAALAGKTIEVLTGVEIFVDGEKLEPTDANGNPVETFVYNGTTYVPLRAVSQYLGKDVAWDGENQSVYINEKEPETVVYTLRFDANGGAFVDGKAPADRQFTAEGFLKEEEAAMPTGEVITKDGASLFGWASRTEIIPGTLMFDATESANKEGDIEGLMEWADENNVVTLYATWE